MSYARPLFSSSSGGGSSGAQGFQGATGAQGNDGQAGGNGGLPLYLNYSETSSAFGTYNYLSTQQTSGNGNQQTYTQSVGTSTQTFLTNISVPSGGRTFPGGIYILNLYTYLTTDVSANISYTLQVVNNGGNVVSTITTSPQFLLTSQTLITSSITSVGSSFTLSSNL